jgi:phage/plasmid-like protein (TIGR03299 family)
MPAYFDTGFSVREPMWHGEGFVAGEYPEDWAMARKWAGLEWEPEERPHFTTVYQAQFQACRECGELVGASHELTCEVGGAASRMQVELIDAMPEGSIIGHDGRHAFVPDPDHKLIVRSDTGAVLGIPSSRFSLIHHGRKVDGGASMEQIIELFVGQGVKFETAGSCKGGEYVWALMYLDEPVTLEGDNTATYPFMALLNNHNGMGSCLLTKTSVRVVCWNTFQMALAEGERHGEQVVFRHTGDVEAKIEEAQASIIDLRDEMKHYQELAAVMMKVKVTDRDMEKYLAEFLPSPAEHGEQISDRVAANIEGARNAFRHIYSDSITCETVKGTAWGVVQASTEYLDHVRAFRSQDTYLGRSILKPEPVKAKALGIAGEIFHDGLAKIDSPWATQITELGANRQAARKLLTVK